MTSNKLYSSLTLAGTLPFITTALLSIKGVDTVPGLGTPAELASSYGLVIACFMAGTHWGIDIARRDRSSFKLFVSSNVITLLVWFAYLVGSTTAAMASQIAAFLSLLAIDYRLQGAGLISKDYLSIRLIATSIVCIALTALIAS